jgi:hypothetical protein
MFAGIKKTLREILSEPAPASTLSWGRIGSSFTLLFSIYWITKVRITTGSLASVDFRSIAEFITAPYAANKISTAIQSFSKKD